MHAPTTSRRCSKGAPDPAPYLDRVRAADAAQTFLYGDDPELPASDVDRATDLDAVAFALKARVESGAPVLRAIPAQF